MESEDSSLEEEDYFRHVSGTGGELPPNWMSSEGEIWQEAVAHFIEQQQLNGTSRNNSEYSPYHKWKNDNSRKLS